VPGVPGLLVPGASVLPGLPGVHVARHNCICNAHNHVQYRTVRYILCVARGQIQYSRLQQ
jgi:hypothetical protein